MLYRLTWYDEFFIIAMIIYNSYFKTLRIKCYNKLLSIPLTKKRSCFHAVEECNLMTTPSTVPFLLYRLLNFSHSTLTCSVFSFVRHALYYTSHEK